MMRWGEEAIEADAFEIRVSELLVATAEASDELIDHAVPEVLKLLREHMKMEVAFISEFVDGRRIYRNISALPDSQVIAEGASDPLERTFCKLVAEGRLPRMVTDYRTHPVTSRLPPAPMEIGSYLSVPVVLKDGAIYGTMCCFSAAANDALAERDLRKLEMSAQLAARRIDERRSRTRAAGA